MRKNLLVLLLCLTAAISCSRPEEKLSRADRIAMEIRNPQSEYVVVACHRGDWRNFPENSIPAIESVISMGADIVEIDLKMTKDSVLVLSHDWTLDRCTTGSGPVSDYTYDQILGLNLKRAHGVATDTVRMPTLRQALSVCKDRICVNVDQGYEYYDQVLAITEELGVTDQILIKGKQPVEVVSAQQAKHEHNMMYMPVVNIQSRSGKELLDSYIESGTVPLAYEICWWCEDGTFETVCDRIREQGARIWVNTIWASLCGGIGNDDDAAFISGDPDSVYGRYMDAGVSMIQTDRPEQIIAYLESIGRHSLK